jgi:membrane-associated phospholipid phosphatase
VVLQYIVISLMLVFNHESDETLYLLCSTSIEIWFVSIFKVLMQSPRPYWVTDTIKPMDSKCKTNFGSPSGHSISCAFFTTYIYFSFIVPRMWRPDVSFKMLTIG